MTSQTKSTPHNELLLLKRNSLLSLAMGLWLIIEVLYLLLEPQFEIYAWSKTLMLSAGGIILFIVIVMLIKTIAIATKVAQKNFWYGKFKDEYFEYINNRGYKFAANILVIFLFLIYFLIDKSVLDLSTRTIADFSQFSAGIGLISYGLPVLFFLRGENE